ncbi:MAG TPA: ABC transporter substrate-binding protein [Chitinophagaceae bacterium]|nr:ABC transporter substrate-binding protein [Chitinophagaceae bacterium]
MKKYLILALFFLTACHQKSKVPVVGFADAFEDNTIEQAKTGFTDALARNGFDEKNGTVKILYRNAQGNIPTLTQIINYFISENVNLIAANASLSAITAIQKTKTIPVFMMVAPTPALMKVNDANGHPPSNLYGVGENLNYIDTSFLLIPKIIKPKGPNLVVGMIYNQSEPQSVEAINRIAQLAKENNITLVSLPVNSSADVQLVTSALLDKHIDAFFANPDNTVFASFETINKLCKAAKVPVFTSEAGLVSRGALVAYGADLYQWGYQAGEQAAKYLKGDTTGLHWEMVQLRKRVYNPDMAKYYQLTIPSGFEPVKQ